MKLELDVKLGWGLSRQWTRGVAGADVSACPEEECEVHEGGDEEREPEPDVLTPKVQPKEDLPNPAPVRRGGFVQVIFVHGVPNPGGERNEEPDKHDEEGGKARCAEAGAPPDPGEGEDCHQLS
jgi:hypothetical protein